MLKINTKNKKTRNEKQRVSTRDITGEALRDHVSGVRNKTFVHRDDGYCDKEPIERYFKTYNEWPEVERMLINKAKGRILEIGCNIGEHLRYLNERGMDAKGIDISQGAIELARERGVKNVFLMDARKMTFEDKSFETVLILYYGFGLGGAINSQKRMLRNIYRMTTDNGKVICSSIDALKTDQSLHIAYQDYNKKRRKPYGNITQVTLRLQHKNRFGEWYNLLFINPMGLHQLLKNTGWRISEIIPEKEGGRAWYYVLSK